VSYVVWYEYKFVKKKQKPKKPPKEQLVANYPVMNPDMRFSTSDDERMNSLKLAMCTEDHEIAICMECASVFDVAARVLSTVEPVDDDHLQSLAAISALAHPVTQKWLKRCAADPDINNIHASRGTKLNCGVIMLTARKLERPLLKDVQMTLSFDAKTIPFLKGNVFALDFPRKARKHHSLLSCKVQKHAIFNSLGEQYAQLTWPEGKGLFFAGIAGWSKQDEFLADQALRLKDEHEIDEMEYKEDNEPSKSENPSVGSSSPAELTNYVADMVTGSALNPLAGYCFKQARQGNPGALVFTAGSWGQLTWSFLTPQAAPWTFLAIPELLVTVRTPSFRERIKDVDFEKIFMFIVKVEGVHGPPHSIIRTVDMDDVESSQLDLDMLRSCVDHDMSFCSVDMQDRISIESATGFQIQGKNFVDLTTIADTAGRACTYCARVPVRNKLNVCQGCKETYYCDITCQKNDWNRKGDPWHSRWCGKIRSAVADQ
jgi:hypothetical protein